MAPQDESLPAKRSERAIALDAIQRLPEDATYEDIIYAVYVCHGIEEGLEDIRQGRTVPHEEVMREVAEWLAAGSREGALGHREASP